MFSLARALPSPVSAEDCSSLFDRFTGTMAQSDSSEAYLSAVWPNAEGVSAIVEGWCGGGGRFVRIDSPKTTLLKGHHRREKTVSYRQSGRENRDCEHRAVRKG